MTEEFYSTLFGIGCGICMLGYLSWSTFLIWTDYHRYIDWLKKHPRPLGIDWVSSALGEFLIKLGTVVIWLLLILGTITVVQS